MITTKKVSQKHFRPIPKRLRTPINDLMTLPNPVISPGSKSPQEYKDEIISLIKLNDISNLKLLIQKHGIDCNQTLLSLQTRHGEIVPITLFQFLILEEKLVFIQEIYLHFPISEENLNLSYYFAHQMSNEEIRNKSVQLLHKFGVNDKMDHTLLDFDQARVISKEKNSGYDLIQAVLHGQVKAFDQKITLYYYQCAFNLAFYFLEKHVDILLSSTYRKLTEQDLPLDHPFFTDRFFDAIKAHKKHLIDMFLSISLDFIDQKKKTKFSFMDTEKYLSPHDYAKLYAPDLTDYLKKESHQIFPESKKLKT